MLDIQKGSLVKRIAAGILDLILLVVLAVGLMVLISKITKFDENQSKLEAIVAEYEVTYDVDLSISEEDYNNYTEDQKNAYNEKLDNLNAALKLDNNYLKYLNMSYSLIALMVTFGLLIAYLLLEFLVPAVFFKNGQTLGKKMFGLGLVNQNCVKISTFQLFSRTIFGKFVVETMIPLYLLALCFLNIMGIIGLIVIAGIYILEIIVLLANNNRPLIHDLFAYTVVCDLQSQKIFNSEQERVNFVADLAAQEAKNN